MAPILASPHPAVGAILPSGRAADVSIDSATRGLSLVREVSMARMRSPGFSRIVHEEYDSPLGRLFLAQGVRRESRMVPVAVLFVGPKAGPTAISAGTENPSHYLERFYPDVPHATGPCRELSGRLDRYFKKGEWEPMDVPAELAGTDFQHAVWKKIARIPAGKRRTYGEIAAALGKPRAARGVGQATGANPLSIVVPCHRVVGAGGRITGYGGGIGRKEWLLRWEEEPARP
jgi:O-6-methylguanine DNA methyltransferase